MGLFLSSPCRIKGNAAVAVIAMEHLLELEPEVAGNYVLLSNIYADLGRWDGVSGVRKLIQGKIMSKKAGCSATEVDNVVEEFMSGDESKPFSGEVYSMLRLLSSHQITGEKMVGGNVGFLNEFSALTSSKVLTPMHQIRITLSMGSMMDTTHTMKKMTNVYYCSDLLI